jgi:hypothetical protein
MPVTAAHCPVRNVHFSNVRLTPIVSEKSLKFGAISADLSSKCGQP